MAQKGKKAVLASAHNEISQMHRQPLIRKSNRRSRPWIAMGGRSGLLMRIAATENVSLCTRMKS
jgi:hypothetical protein